jgi:predicted unusual protein kinase regulating ubiquinone biosynthesis (AarF/ABC1/UbiB family)
MMMSLVCSCGARKRIAPERRRAYCKLIIGLYDGDMDAVREALRGVGYINNQTERAPERDAEFFEYLFRDATVSG